MSNPPSICRRMCLFVLSALTLSLLVSITLLTNMNGYCVSGCVYPFWNTHLLHTYHHHHHAMAGFQQATTTNNRFYYAKPYVIVYINPMLIKCWHAKTNITYVPWFNFECNHQITMLKFLVMLLLVVVAVVAAVVFAVAVEIVYFVIFSV